MQGTKSRRRPLPVRSPPFQYKASAASSASAWLAAPNLIVAKCSRTTLIVTKFPHHRSSLTFPPIGSVNWQGNRGRKRGRHQPAVREAAVVGSSRGMGGRLTKSSGGSYLPPASARASEGSASASRRGY
jgi:hypothetical protein